MHLPKLHSQVKYTSKVKLISTESPNWNHSLKLINISVQLDTKTMTITWKSYLVLHNSELSSMNLPHMDCTQTKTSMCLMILQMLSPEHWTPWADNSVTTSTPETSWSHSPSQSATSPASSISHSPHTSAINSLPDHPLTSEHPHLSIHMPASNKLFSQNGNLPYQVTTSEATISIKLRHSTMPTMSGSPMVKQPLNSSLVTCQANSELEQTHTVLLVMDLVNNKSQLVALLVLPLTGHKEWLLVIRLMLLL